MKNNYGSSVFTFFTLVFVFSIPFWLLGAIYPIEFLPGLPISALGALTPSVVALILVYKDGHFSEVLQLLQRSFDFRRLKNRNWFLLILLINPAIAVVAYLIIGIIDEPLPRPAPITLAISPIAAFFFVGALVEEIGWTAYATEPLQERWGTLLAGLMLGVIWAVWHFIPLMQAYRTVEWIAWWSLGTISLRMIVTWLYIHSGTSLFAAAVFHMMINLSWQLFPVNGSMYDPQVFGLITLVCTVGLYRATWLRSRTMV